MIGVCFKVLAKLNHLVLPSFSRRVAQYSKKMPWYVLAIVGWRSYVTKRSL